jgi:hypothetical protein
MFENQACTRVSVHFGRANSTWPRRSAETSGNELGNTTHGAFYRKQNLWTCLEHLSIS